MPCYAIDGVGDDRVQTKLEGLKNKFFQAKFQKAALRQYPLAPIKPPDNSHQRKGATCLNGQQLARHGHQVGLA